MLYVASNIFYYVFTSQTKISGGVVQTPYLLNMAFNDPLFCWTAALAKAAGLYQNEYLTSQIIQEEVEEAIREIANNISPGMNGIPYEFHSEDLTEILSKMYIGII